MEQAQSPFFGVAAVRACIEVIDQMCEEPPIRPAPIITLMNIPRRRVSLFAGADGRVQMWVVTEHLHSTKFRSRERDWT